MVATAAALGNVGLAAIATSGALLVVEVTGSESASGLPLALTTAGATVAALLMTRLALVRGRSFALLVGFVVGTVGATVVVWGATVDRSTTVLAGNLLMGGAITATALTRYAAAAVSEPARQGRGLSIAVATGTIGAVAGPNLYAPVGRLVEGFGLDADAGLYALAVPTLALAAVATWAAGAHPALGRTQQPTGGPQAGTLAVVLSRAARRYVVALAAANLVMVGAMAVVPLRMSEAGHGHGAVGTVVSLHLLAMFAPSPLSGYWADRVGAGRVATTGLVVIAAGCLLLVPRPGGAALVETTGALALLGVGWNLALVGGSAGIFRSVLPASRARVEAPVEAVMSVCAAVGALGAGLLHTAYGLGAVGVLGAVICAIAVVTPTLAGSVKTLLDRPPHTEVADPERGGTMLTVHLIVRGADDASAWYRDVLGLHEESRVVLPDGRLINVVLRSPSAAITLADEFPEHGAIAPSPREQTPVVLYLDVDDVDRVWARAVAAGATVRRDLGDAFWGAREGQFVDPFGHVWGITQHTRDVSHAELSALAAAAFSGPEG